MLGDVTDETDSRKKHTGSVLESVRNGLLKVVPGYRSRPKSNESLDLYQARMRKVKNTDTNTDSALPSEGSDCETEVCAASAVMLESRRSSAGSVSISHAIQMDSTLQFRDSTKSPAARTSVCIMSQRSHQGDGLLQVSETTIGTYAESPVYLVDFKGKLDDPRTFLVWYPLEYDDPQARITLFLHVLDPAEKIQPKGSQSDIPREKFTYRLAWFKKDDQYVLAAQKAPRAVLPFHTMDGALDLTYHSEKGGTITVSQGRDRLLGTSADGEVMVVKKPVWSGFCDNPFTLFYVYDDGCGVGKFLRQVNGK